MLEIFFSSVLITVLFTPFGHFFVSSDNFNLYYYTKKLIYSLIFLSFLAILVNFFFPLNLILNSLLIPISIIFIIYKWKCYSNLNFLIYLFGISILMSILLYGSNVYRPDAGLYHLPYIGILNSEKIILGLSNLHFRYGHISTVQYLSAISNNLILKENGIVFIQAIIGSAVIINFTYQIYNYNRKKNYNFHFLYLFFVFVYFFFKMNRYSEYGNDAPAHFLLFFFISELILFNEKRDYKNYNNLLLLVFFIVQNKLTLIFLILFNLIHLKDIRILNILKEKKFIFLVFFFSIWIVKNIMTTGCMLYPVGNTCFKSLAWTDINEVKKISIESEAWTKGWIDLEDKNETDMSQFVENFEWVKTWLNKHSKFISKTIFPYIIFSILLTLIITFKSKRNKQKINKNLYYYLVAFLICCIFWFIKTPLYRYGYSFLISLFSFLLAIYSLKYRISLSKSKIFNSVLILGFIVFFSKNFLRIIETEDYYNHPWPKFYSMKDGNNIEEYKVKKISNIKIRFPIDGYCMYINKICSHYESNIDNLLIEKKANYLIIKKK